MWTTDGRAKALMDRKVVEVSSLSLSFSLFLSLFLSLSFPLFLWLSTYLPTYVSIYLSIHPAIYLSVCLSTCLSASVKTKLFCETSSVFELDNIKNAAIQQDFLNFCTWQRQNRSNSARLPHFLSWQHQKRSNSARLPSKMESWVQSWRPRTNAFAIFRLHLSKLLRLPRKSDAGSYKVLHLSRKIISANLKIWCSKQNATPLRKSAPGPPNSSDEHVSCRLPRKMHLCRSSSNVPRLPSLWKGHTTLTFCSLLTRCTIPCACHAKRHLNVKMCSGPLNFCTFDFEMCFAPQRRAPFRHLNFQKRSDPLVFCAFWLRNVLRATMACTFSTSQLPKVVRPPGVLCILTSKCASRHDGVHFFDISTSKSGPNPGVLCILTSKCASRQNGVHFFDISTSRSGPSPWYFVKFWLGNALRATTACNCSSLIWPAGSAPAALASLRFDPPEPQLIGKNTVFVTFLPFRAPGSSFFWGFLFLDLLSSSFFFFLLLFSSLLWLFPPLLFICPCPYCRKFDF